MDDHLRELTYEDSILIQGSSSSKTQIKIIKIDRHVKRNPNQTIHTQIIITRIKGDNKEGQETHSEAMVTSCRTFLDQTLLSSSMVASKGREPSRGSSDPSPTISNTFKVSSSKTEIINSKAQTLSISLTNTLDLSDSTRCSTTTNL